MILTDLRIARIMLSSITEATRKLTGTLSSHCLTCFCLDIAALPVVYSYMPE